VSRACIVRAAQAQYPFQPDIASMFSTVSPTGGSIAGGQHYPLAEHNRPLA
jgi:hypothetical protein